MSLSKQINPFKILFCTTCLATIYLQPTYTSNLRKIQVKTWHRSHYTDLNYQPSLDQVDDFFGTWLGFIQDGTFAKNHNEYDVDKDSLFFYGEEAKMILDKEDQIQFLKNIITKHNINPILYVDCPIQLNNKNLNIATKKGHTAIANVLQEMIDFKTSHNVKAFEQSIQEKEIQVKSIDHELASYTDKEKPYNRLKDFNAIAFGKGLASVTKIIGTLDDYKDLLDSNNTFPNLRDKVQKRIRELAMKTYKETKPKPELKKTAIENMIKEEDAINILTKKKDELAEQKETLKQAIETLKIKMTDAVKNVEDKTKALKVTLMQAQAHASKEAKSSSQTTSSPQRNRNQSSSLNTNVPNNFSETTNVEDTDLQQTIQESLEQDQEININNIDREQQQMLDQIAKNKQAKARSNGAPRQPNINIPQPRNPPLPGMGGNTGSTGNTDLYIVASVVVVFAIILFFPSPKKKTPKEKETKL